MDELRSFMFENVYIGSSAKEEEGKVYGVMSGLFDYYMKNPSAMPDTYGQLDGDGLEQAVCDYIAGMSDRYAIYSYTDIYIPKSWNKI